jgi:hypothetical protein
MGILIIPVGKVEQDIVSALSASLSKTFHQKVKAGKEMPVPLNSSGQAEG